MMKAKQIKLAASVSEDYVLQNFPRLVQFSKRLDEVDPIQAGRSHKDQDDYCIYRDPQRGVALDGYVAEMEAKGFKFVLAWYEQRQSPDGNKTYHNVVFVFSDQEEGASVNLRFRPVRPAIRTELDAFIRDSIVDVRDSHDRPYRDQETDVLVEGKRRWDIFLNNRQPTGKKRRQIPFCGAEEVAYQMA